MYGLVVLFELRACQNWRGCRYCRNFMSQQTQEAHISHSEGTDTAMRVLVALGISHMLNDILQALLPSIYPMLKADYELSFSQIGLITFTFQAVASLLQPLVGAYTDKRPMPYSLAFGMGATLIGLVLLSQASTFAWILFSAALIGTGSAIFHPEASRMARMASGGQHGLAQSLFQVGGNLGTSFGPLLAAFVVLTYGQWSLALFSLLALAAIVLLTRVGAWYSRHLGERLKRGTSKAGGVFPALERRTIVRAMAVLIALIFSKYVYLASITSYYTFYLIHHFGVSIQHSQIFLFVFLFAVALGTILGGPIGDRVGRKPVIWVSILGVAPFTLLLPHVSLVWTVVLTVPIGVVLASAFSAIIVYAQELLPGKVGLVAGLFFGMAFGIAGLSSALLGWVADARSIEYVYLVCSFLPLIGVVTVFLPNIEGRRL